MRAIEVGGDDVILGSDDAAHVVFPDDDDAIGGYHAALRWTDGALWLRDLASAGGTWLEGRDVEEAELFDGDVITLGRGGPQVRVEIGDGATEGSTLRLRFRSGRRQGETLDAGGAVVRLGRAPGNTVVLSEDRVVSAQHAKIVRLADGFVLMDLESRNGTYLNGRRVDRAGLSDGDVIGLAEGGPEIEVGILATAGPAGGATIVLADFSAFGRRTAAAHSVQEVPLPAGGVTFGRDPMGDVVLDSPIVSRRHGRLRPSGEGWTVEDLGSGNGIYVRGARLTEPATLAPGDLVVVGPFQLEIGPGVLRIHDTRRRSRLDVVGLGIEASGRSLLDDVSFPLPAGSFTAIIGPSGSGKSTLLAALDGTRAPSRGRVLLNGVDLRDARAARGLSGSVPQDDIVHRELTVGESLDFTARLRLPPDTSPEERERRVAAVLATLELTERRDVPVCRLSGGQRKRVSIAVELLTEPDLLFLDEPAAGLDPGLEEGLMLLLRELAYKGKTVVVVTHALDNIHLCDAVALLMDGRLVYHGAPAAAAGHFGVGHPTEMYRRLRERPAEEWRAAFQPSPPPDTGSSRSPSSQKSVPGMSPRAGFLRQLSILTGRYATILSRDRRNLGLLAAQAPLVALLIGLSMLYGSAEVGYTKPRNTLLFLLALVSVWFGCSNAARELVKERAIYWRERRVHLDVAPYLFSKVLVLLALAFVQCAVFFGILHLWFGLPGSIPALIGSMLLASAVGIALGLMLSALSATPDRAMTLLPILLIPQVLFTIPAVQMDMKGPAGLVARAMPTWWAYDLVRRTALKADAALDDDALEARLDGGATALVTRARFEDMLGQGYRMWNYRSQIELTWTASFPERIAARVGVSPRVVDIAALLGFFMVLLGTALWFQSRAER